MNRKFVNRKLIHRRDLLVMAAIFISAVIVHLLISGFIGGYARDFIGDYAGGSTNAGTGSLVYAVISVRGYQDITLDMSVDGDFILPQNHNVVIQIRDGRAAFIASDCPDQICVRSGFLERPSQSAACLPNTVALVVGGSY